MNRRSNLIATPPGATIKEQLRDRGVSETEFASRMGMSEECVSNLLNEYIPLTPKTAAKLETVFGIPAKFWTNLEAIYQEKVKEK